jgi:hypothetical protein
MAGVQCKFVVYFFKLRLVSWDSDALRKPSHVSYINVVGKAVGQKSMTCDFTKTRFQIT